MDEGVKKILSEGLSSGYVGKTERISVDRNGFPFEASTYNGPEGHYHDQWAAHRTGGGQEMVEIGGKKYTRVYAGGTIFTEELQKLGIPEGEENVNKRLVKFINSISASSTRLDQDVSAKDGKWDYSYKVMDREDRVPVILGKEEIRYVDTLVFVHYHIMCPVE